MLALPIFDTSFAIIRRIIKQKSIKAVFKADRGHLHHKLIDRGYSQKQAVFILYGISATFGLFAIILLESGLWKAISFALLVASIVAIGYKDIFRVKKEKISQDEKQTGINLIAQVIAFGINLGISFFLTPFIVEKIGVEANGFVSLANNFVEYAQLITISINSMAGRFITIKLHQKIQKMRINISHLFLLLI